MAKIIVNAARAIDTQGGVSNVAHALDREFNKLGYQTRTFTQKDTGLPHLEPKVVWLQKIWLFVEVVWASTIGTWLLKRKYPQSQYFIICHNDYMTGQLYINHGLHKALLKQNGYWRMILRNPIHLVLWLREELRHTSRIHQSVVCFSAAQQQELLATFPKLKSKTVIIPNGIDLNRFHPNHTQPADVPLLKPNGSKLLLFVGYEFNRKGLSHALEALLNLPEEWRLAVVGGDEMQIRQYKQTAHSRGIAERVCFTGPRSDVEKLYPIANCFVLPADFEPWGLVAIEAMASGTPVVMTPVGSSADFLLPDVNGYFCQQDGQHIAQQIIKAEQLKQSDILNSVQHFAWGEVAKRYQQELNNA